MAGFGDHVRITTTEQTERLGLAGREGTVFGFTTPSVTAVKVIGVSTDDYAINVHFDHLNESFWFAEDLIEFIDHQPGQVIGLGNLELVRNSDGEW